MPASTSSSVAGVNRMGCAWVVCDQNGRRAVFGQNEYFQSDPQWRDLVPFYEYFASGYP